MYLYSLSLKNVRQFQNRTFEFQPGFNLLVGENGAGKTTLLRGLLAAIGSARQVGRRPVLEDHDIRLGREHAEVRAHIQYTNQSSEEFRFGRTLWGEEVRSVHKGQRPLVLTYSSNEAVCSAMKMKPAKRTREYDKDSTRRSEEFLYESEMLSTNDSREVKERRFGDSQSVRGFVNKVLSTFSPSMSEFYWRFEPYDCALVFDDNSNCKIPLTEEVQKQARAIAMRWFEESTRSRRRSPSWPDQAKVVLTRDGSERKRISRGLPYLKAIFGCSEFPLEYRKIILSCSLEVKLAPRIMLQRDIGTLGLNQLSDGEQRLFSLFVDIARQLSLKHSNDRLGEGEAIILIDEIDVHLHPKWQRRIVPALEDLFPNCQFIATTHSPFVIQATSRQQITSIDSMHSHRTLDGGNSIEDIAEEIQGVRLPQRSVRAENLSNAAKEYFALLEKRKNNERSVSSARLRAAEQTYREASEPFASDPAVHALLKILAMGGKGQ